MADLLSAEGNYPPGSVGAECERIQGELDKLRESSPVIEAAFEIRDAFERIKEAIIQAFKKIVDVLTPYIKKFIKWAAKAWKVYVLAYCTAAGVGRIGHLAIYGKKKRTRKKNMKRILKMMKEDGDE